MSKTKVRKGYIYDSIKSFNIWIFSFFYLVSTQNHNSNLRRDKNCLFRNQVLVTIIWNTGLGYLKFQIEAVSLTFYSNRKKVKTFFKCIGGNFSRVVIAKLRELFYKLRHCDNILRLSIIEHEGSVQLMHSNGA